MDFKRLCAFVFLLVPAIVPASAQAEITLKFGLYTSDKPSQMVRQFRPILTALESALQERLGEAVKITTNISRTYQQGIDNLVTGKVDFARFGPASYIAAKAANPDITVLAMESSKGQRTFRGVIVVHRESRIRTVEDLRGRTFAFGDRNSTVGRYLSQSYLIERGIAMRDLAGHDYLGRHDRVGTAVAIKKFDAGALKEGTFNKLVAKGHPLRVIGSFDVPTKPWIARSGLSQRIVGALRRELLDMADPAALRALDKDGFFPAGDSDYDTIRDAVTAAADFMG